MKKETVLFFIFSIFLATVFMGVIYLVLIIVATQSVGIWSNLVGFLLFLSLLGICAFLNPYERKEKTQEED